MCWARAGPSRVTGGGGLPAWVMEAALGRGAMRSVQTESETAHVQEILVLPRAH